MLKGTFDLYPTICSLTVNMNNLLVSMVHVTNKITTINVSQHSKTHNYKVRYVTKVVFSKDG